MKMIVLQARDHALLHALNHARILTVNQIQKHFFSKTSKAVCRNRLNKLAGSHFVQNVRDKSGYQIGFKHGMWALDKNGFNFLNVKKKNAFKGLYSLIHQLNLNDIMLSFFDDNKNSNIIWNPDGSFRYESALGNFDPDAVIFNPNNHIKILLEYDNSTKYRKPLVENLSKYIVWYSENKNQKVFLHYSVNDLKRASFIRDAFDLAYKKQRDIYHLTESDLIPLSISLKNCTHLEIEKIIFENKNNIGEENKFTSIKNFPNWLETGS